MEEGTSKLRPENESKLGRQIEKGMESNRTKL